MTGNCKTQTKSPRTSSLIASAVALLFASQVAFVNGEDYTLWTYSKKFGINTTIASVACDVTNFPVLIRLNSTNFGSNFGQCLDNGADVRFADQNGVQLAYEIESWDAGNQKAAIWVRVPTVKGNNSTQYVKMYWGASTGSTTTSQSNGAAVFNTANDFTDVCHLNGSNYTDASGNGNNGTQSVNAPGTTGVIGAGKEFDGVDDYVTFGTSAGSASSLTAAIWLRPHSVKLFHPFGKLAQTGTQGWDFLMRPASENNAIHFRIGSDGSYGGWPDAVRATNAYTANTWVYLVATYDNSTKTGRIYINGVQRGSYTNTDLRGVANTGKNLIIGKAPNGGYEPFDGEIDEMEVSKIARSADWIKLCFANQRDGQTMITEGVSLKITDDGRGTTNTQGGEAFGSITMTITATPWPGYKFVKWVVYGPATIGDSTLATTTVSIPSGNAVVRANFAPTDPSAASTPAYPISCGAGNSMVVDGKVTVGAGLSDQNATNLVVTGRIQCDGLQIKDWLFKQKTPDFVFKPDYKLQSLSETAAFIKEHGHLPGVKSASELQKEGLDLTEFNMVLLKKIEELTLHQIEQEKEIEKLKGKVQK